MFWKQISITWILFKTTQSVHVVCVYMSGFMQCCEGLNTKYDKKYTDKRTDCLHEELLYIFDILSLFQVWKSYILVYPLSVASYMYISIHINLRWETSPPAFQTFCDHRATELQLPLLKELYSSVLFCYIIWKKNYMGK